MTQEEKDLLLELVRAELFACVAWNSASPAKFKRERIRLLKQLRKTLRQ